MASTSSQLKPKTRLTLRVSAELIHTAREAVSLGLASSTTAFVEDAVRARVREVRHARMRVLAAEADADAGFLEDMRATASAFSAVQPEDWPTEDEHDQARVRELPSTDISLP